MNKRIVNAKQELNSTNLDDMLTAFQNGAVMFDENGARIRSEVQLAGADLDTLQVEVTDGEPAGLNSSTDKKCDVCGNGMIRCTLMAQAGVTYCSRCHHTDWTDETRVSAKPNPVRRRIKLECAEGICRMIEN